MKVRLITTTDEYRRKFGCYPESYLVDRSCRPKKTSNYFYYLKIVAGVPDHIVNYFI